MEEKTKSVYEKYLQYNDPRKDEERTQFWQEKIEQAKDGYYDVKGQPVEVETFAGKVCATVTVSTLLFATEKAEDKKGLSLKWLKKQGLVSEAVDAILVLDNGYRDDQIVRQISFNEKDPFYFSREAFRFVK